MKRSFLKELGLESEVIDKIMSENGKDIEKYKSDIEDYVSEIKEFKSTNTDKEKAIEEAVRAKEDELKKEFEVIENDYKSKLEKVSDYSTKVEELEILKKANLEREEAKNLKKFFKDNDVTFTSNSAEESIISKIKEKKFKVVDGEFEESAINFLNELKENDIGAFEATIPSDSGTLGNFQRNPGSGTNDLASQVNSILGL